MKEASRGTYREARGGKLLCVSRVGVGQVQGF